mgnify:CR=1 FL=1|tara:strand:+ start:773 stop:1669 length:897 start_codon:yes stop_codon:yes gene_type:complete
MKNYLVVILLFFAATFGFCQTATVGKPQFDVQGPLYLRQNLYTLNKQANGWVTWATRDTSTPESTFNFSNINNAYFQGNVGIGTNTPLAKLHVINTAINQSSTSKIDANLIIQGTSSTRSISEGAALGFAVPSNTSGSSYWQQGRILVTPDNTNNSNASGRMYLQTRYLSQGAWHWKNNLVLLSSGGVGIGTEVTGSHKLAVDGSIGAREIKVEVGNWSDFVFYEDYNLPTLTEVETHIRENGHLQDIPSAVEVEKTGINLGEMNAKLLQKIEELMLYTIQQQKEIDKLKSDILKIKE